MVLVDFDLVLFSDDSSVERSLPALESKTTGLSLTTEAALVFLIGFSDSLAVEPALALVLVAIVFSDDSFLVVRADRLDLVDPSSVTSLSVDGSRDECIDGVSDNFFSDD